MTLRIGTRGSPLALAQSRTVARAVERATGQSVELVIVRTGGDRDQTTPLPDFGGAGAFTREIDEQQLAGRFELSVHSLKDLPTEGRTGLRLAAVPSRAPVEDVLVASGARRLVDLPSGATVGTGSLRRRAQLLRARPDLDLRDLRGNVDTRIARAIEGDLDAVLLARAGLQRLGREAVVSDTLPTTMMLPAAGQGALAIVCRTDDEASRAAVATLDDVATHAAVLAERTVLGVLGGGCHLPIGVLAFVETNEPNETNADTTRLTLTARVVSADGRDVVEETAAAPRSEAAQLGRRVAESLIRGGARELLP